MSDEFIKIAIEEINEEISELDKILSTCQNDANIFSNADKFQKHAHKIKGLAPMMGKEELGLFSGMLESILKKMIEGIAIDDVFSVLTDSVFAMKQSMSETDYNFIEIKTRIYQILNNLN